MCQSLSSHVELPSVETRWQSRQDRSQLTLVYVALQGRRDDARVIRPTKADTVVDPEETTRGRSLQDPFAHPDDRLLVGVVYYQSSNSTRDNRDGKGLAAPQRVQRRYR